MIWNHIIACPCGWNRLIRLRLLHIYGCSLNYQWIIRIYSTTVSWEIPPAIDASHCAATSPLTLVTVHNSAYLSMVTFGETTSQIRDTIMSMALAQDTLPGLALFYALLAFSSLHRYGLNQQAMQLKISALHFLSASVKDEPLITVKATQHVAASMLLVAFEVCNRECPAQEKVSSYA